MAGFFVSFLTWVSLAIFYLDQCQMETYYAQHPALKSVYGKSESVIGGKLFSSYRTVFGLAQGLWDSKTSDTVNCSCEALAQKEGLTICQDRLLPSFSCALSLSSVFVLGSFISLLSHWWSPLHRAGGEEVGG